MRIALTVCLVLLVSGVSSGQPQSGSGALTVQSLMSAQDFERCGLTKLTPLELKNLNTWFQTYTRHAQSVGSDTTDGSTESVIETQIDGVFKGWDGETVFKLTNGQIWQQSLYAYTYHYAYRPSVVIYRTAGGFKMRVEGVQETIYVRRLK